MKSKTICVSYQIIKGGGKQWGIWFSTVNRKKMNILITILVGAVCGYLGGLIMNMSGSWLFNIIIGLVGGALGGWIHTLIPLPLPGIVGSIIYGVAGTCVLLLIFKLLFKRK